MGKYFGMAIYLVVIAWGFVVGMIITPILLPVAIAWRIAQAEADDAMVAYRTARLKQTKPNKAA